jgi:hypothetical protein
MLTARLSLTRPTGSFPMPLELVRPHFLRMPTSIANLTIRHSREVTRTLIQCLVDIDRTLLDHVYLHCVYRAFETAETQIGSCPKVIYERRRPRDLDLVPRILMDERVQPWIHASILIYTPVPLLLLLNHSAIKVLDAKLYNAIFKLCPS